MLVNLSSPKASNMSQANIFCYSLDTSEPTGLPGEIKFIGGSCYKHHFCRDKHVFCHDKSIFVTTDIILSFIVTSKCFSRQKILFFIFKYCGSSRQLMIKEYFFCINIGRTSGQNTQVVRFHIFYVSSLNKLSVIIV